MKKEGDGCYVSWITLQGGLLWGSNLPHQVSTKHPTDDHQTPSAKKPVGS
jgi:hypothetical protein